MECPVNLALEEKELWFWKTMPTLEQHYHWSIAQHQCGVWQTPQQQWHR